MELNERKTTWARAAREDFLEEEMFKLGLKGEQALDRSKWTRKQVEASQRRKKRKMFSELKKKSHCSWSIHIPLTEAFPSLQ